jgi:hypothetical protein
VRRTQFQFPFAFPFSGSWRFTVVTFLLIVFLAGTPILNDIGSLFAWVTLSESQVTPLGKSAGQFDNKGSASDAPNDVAFRANLIPAVNNGLTTPRPNPPVWEQIDGAKPIRVIAGFFFAIMVISLFFMFYRNSRNGSGVDDDHLDICCLGFVAENKI